MTKIIYNESFLCDIIVLEISVVFCEKNITITVRLFIFFKTTYCVTIVYFNNKQKMFYTCYRLWE